MSMPFYVAPEQVMDDRADYAAQGHRPRSQPRRGDGQRRHRASVPRTRRATLRKINEIYDRIAFAGVGKYNEFDQLRVAGVRHADLKGYAYSRDDVDARSLANQYAQILGQVFTHEMKPMEVEILVAEVGATPEEDRLFHILYDGTIMDEDRFSVLGGDAEAVDERVRGSRGSPTSTWGARARAWRCTASPLPTETSHADELEVAILERNGRRRAFRRIETSPTSPPRWKRPARSRWSRPPTGS